MQTPGSEANRWGKLYTTLPALILASLAFLFFALYNRYPLMNSDSGAYINNGFHLNEVPADRPVLYSLFIRLTSLSTSLWLPVFVQSFILSHSIFQLLHAFFEKIRRSTFVAFTGLTVLLTGAGWFSGQLMPDIFTAILAISIINFLLLERFRWLNAGIILSCALMHNSNFISLLCFSIPLLAVSAIWKPQYIPIRKTMSLLGISLVSWILVCSYHASMGYGFRPSRSSHVFLMGKLCENGILKSWLDENCGDKNYKLCNYRDQLPVVAWDFVWSPDGPFQKTGGWDSSAEEYNEIIRGTLSSPKFLLMHTLKSAQATLVQTAQIDVGLDFGPLLENSNPYWKVNEYYQNELPQYKSSRQNSGSIQIRTYDILYEFYFAVSGLLALLVISRLPDKRKLYCIYLICGLMILCNAFATASFANVLSRLNSRLIWIIPMINTICIWKYLSWKIRSLAESGNRIAEY